MPNPNDPRPFLLSDLAAMSRIDEDTLLQRLAGILDRRSEKEPMMKHTQAGDKLYLSDTNLLVLTDAQPSTRDGNWRIRIRVLDGKWTGQELWMVSDHSSGPWSTPGAGFV